MGPHGKIIKCWIFTISIIYPLKIVHHFNLHLEKKSWTPKAQKCFMQNLVKLAQWFLRRRWNCKKLVSDRLTDRQTDNRQQVIRQVSLIRVVHMTILYLGNITHQKERWKPQSFTRFFPNYTCILRGWKWDWPPKHMPNIRVNASYGICFCV